MKRILLALLLVVSTSAVAYPYWTVVAKDNNVTVYANLDTIPNHNKIVTIWFLADFVSSKSSAQSSLIQEMYNCDKQLQKTLQIDVFTEHMGKGDSKHLSLPRAVKKWHHIVLDSDEEMLWRVACNL